MLSRKPYLVRAIYHWLVDSGFTPYLMVEASYPGCKVPEEYVNDGQIVLNISPSAVGDFNWDNALIEFSARFGGVERFLSIPVGSILSLVSKETGEGMNFEIEIDLEVIETLTPEKPVDDADKTPAAKRAPFLKVVK